MKIQAISDLHIDYTENLKWLKGLSRYDYQADILILGGDVSHHIPLIETAFYQLKKVFREVIFVPGNHDLWVKASTLNHSLEKFDLVNQLAKSYGIHTTALHLEQLTILPLLGWYDYSFGFPTRYAMDSWQDFYACQWRGFADMAAVTRHFLAFNEKELLNVRQGVPTITFSHFLPRIDVMPDYIPEDRRFIYPFLGSSGLEQQLRRVHPIMHIYGHSHLNRRVTLEGVEYINNAFAYPDETRISKKQLLCVYEC